MNSLKTLAIVAMLAAVAYGVYVSINRNPETATAPDNAPPWPGAPTVQIPGLGAPNVQIPGPGAPTAQIPGPGAPDVQVPRAGPSNFPTPGAGAPKGQLPGPGAAASPPLGEAYGTEPATRYGPLAPSAGGPAAAQPGAGPGGNTAPLFTPPEKPPEPVAPQAQGTPNLLPGNGQLGTPAGMYSPDGGLPAGKRRSIPDKFATYMQNVQDKLDQRQLAEALLTLTPLYDTPDLTPEQSQQVTDLLDRLAGTVIYSRQHLLEGQPYVVQQGETLEQIAQQYNVPWQLLARINGVRDPQRPQPGQELKVVRGPFTAVIDLNQHELTMMLKGHYAGRFPIGVGADHQNLEGTYVVRDKTVNPHYYGPDRVEIDADDPNNPLGELWIGLDDQVGIHGANDPGRIRRTGGRGSICLGDQDIEDVFGILSIGSRVVIRR